MTITDVKYCFRTAEEIGVGGHPQLNVEAYVDMYGLKILKSEPITVADIWIFRLQGELPDDMPKYLKVLPEPYWKGEE